MKTAIRQLNQRLLQNPAASEAVTVRPLSSAWTTTTEWTYYTPAIEYSRSIRRRRRKKNWHCWDLRNDVDKCTYILRDGCEPGKSKRICDPTGISPNFLTLHSFSWKRLHCVLSFYWADTGFKVYRLNRFGLNSYILSTSCHMRLTLSEF